MIKNWKMWLVVAGLVLAVCLGVYGTYKLKVEPLQEKNATLQAYIQGLEQKNIALEKAMGILQKEKNEIRAQTVTVTETELVYVNKEIDPSTGQKEATDVDVTIDPQVINVLVNGKPFEVPMLAGEEYVFENGKLVLKQASVMTLDLQLPEAERKGLRFGPFVGYNRDNTKVNIGAKVRYERPKWDADISINQDKKVNVEFQYWLN